VKNTAQMAEFLTPTTVDAQQLLQQNQKLFVENAQRSQIEQVLYNAWLSVKNARKDLEAEVNRCKARSLPLKYN
jgi:hypothetical protein